ncbi:hypothetical protein LCGC14_0357680 [marine sediment metagenome]|uniref:Uncharacterized protein n=1 Tax=marine sediment metagenome TaxID=412755 RepID=A0A0F9WGX4_9ZZZZ
MSAITNIFTDDSSHYLNKGEARPMYSPKKAGYTWGPVTGSVRSAAKSIQGVNTSVRRASERCEL